MLTTGGRYKSTCFFLTSTFCMSDYYNKQDVLTVFLMHNLRVIFKISVSYHVIALKVLNIPPTGTTRILLTVNSFLDILVCIFFNLFKYDT